MRRLISLLFILFSLNIFSQADSITSFKNDSLLVYTEDSVDVAAMLQAQIIEAQMRDSLGIIKSLAYESYNNKILRDIIEVEEEKTTLPDETLLSTLEEKLFNKYSILSVFSVSILTAVVVRRKRVSKGRKFRNELKEKIQSVREEMLIPKEETGLKLLRNKLLTLPEPELFNKTLSAKARELNISKGELILAARIKSFQMSQLTLNKEVRL